MNKTTLVCVELDKSMCFVRNLLMCHWFILPVVVSSNFPLPLICLTQPCSNFFHLHLILLYFFVCLLPTFTLPHHFIFPSFSTAPSIPPHLLLSSHLPSYPLCHFLFLSFVFFHLLFLLFLVFFFLTLLLLCSYPFLVFLLFFFIFFLLFLIFLFFFTFFLCCFIKCIICLPVHQKTQAQSFAK